MKLNKWFYLAALSFIWGSSFILIKKGLVGLTAIELGSIRIIISAFVLIPFTFNRLKEITFKQWKWIIISAFVAIISAIVISIATANQAIWAVIVIVI